MLNLSDKRQYFRFPAYDDEVGVKLVSNKRRDFLKDVLEDGFVYQEQQSYSKRQKKQNVIKTMNIDQVEMVDTPDYFGYGEKEGIVETPVTPKHKPTAFKQKQVTLEKKQTKIENNTYAEPSHGAYTSPQSSFSNKLFETDVTGKAKYQNNDRKRSKFESSYDLPGAKGKSMFKPKHIPASLIEDEVAPKHHRDVLVEELRKASQGNLLLLEDEIILDPIAEPVDVVTPEDLSILPEKKKCGWTSWRDRLSAAEEKC